MKRYSTKPWQIMLVILAIIFGTVAPTMAQDYEFTLNQRRMGNQIGVEVWAKSLNASAKNLADMSISVEYNTEFLAPAGLALNVNPSATTDSVHWDMDITQPYIAIQSPYTNAVFGFTNLQAQSAGQTFQLDVQTAPGTPTGFRPGTDGRGTFIGMLKFNIINQDQLDENDLTQIIFNLGSFPQSIAITAADGTIFTTDDYVLTQPGDFAIRGITILNPNKPSQAINRNPNPAYQSLTPNNGYPVYWERSGLLDLNDNYYYGTPRLAYNLELSLDNGNTWVPVGKLAETNLTQAGMGGNEDWYRQGEISATSAGYFITDGAGTSAITVGVSSANPGYAGVLRTIWQANPDFQFRSEQARFKITQLETDGIMGDISVREPFADEFTSRWDINDFPFVIGRLFFVQLDGTSTYFRTLQNYSNATQLTVEAWINLNSINLNEGAEPAIVASSAGSQSPEEGAWMLYLHEGQFPAFRTREIEGRGDNGYLASLISPYSLDVADASSPISDAHANNWVHIAATVTNNVASLYVNGEIVARYENNNAVDIRMLTTLHPIWVGVNPTGGLTPGDYLHAGVKEARVWRVALDQETLRSHIAGVYDPTNVAFGDERTVLELLYPLQGTRLDEASVEYEQNSRNPLNYYIAAGFSAQAQNQLISYRPDRPHLKLTAPTGGEGISNLLDETFEVRWVAYGIGDVATGTDDVQIMLSRDGGISWFDAIDNQIPSVLLYGRDVETGSAIWEPYNNITSSGQDDDIQGLIDIDGNYSKEVLLKISGMDTRGQDNIYDISSPFIVAPYFALRNDGDAVVWVDNASGLNMSSGATYIEAWIKPYRFPTEEESFFPIVAKQDANGIDYTLGLLPTGQIELAIGSSTGDARRVATSSAHPDSVLLQPNVRVMDSLWYHIGVYVNLNNGGQSGVLFYIDGTPHLPTGLSEDLGSDITVSPTSNKNFYIGYAPTLNEWQAVAFVGELREIRLWNGNPGNQLLGTNNESSDLTQFIQGAATIRAQELGVYLGTDWTANLVASYSMNGGSYINNGLTYSIPVYPNNVNLTASVSYTADRNATPDFAGTSFRYEATQPFMKLVTPTYKQSVPNDLTDLRVRWTGFDYNRNDALESFYTGNNAVNNADLEFSILGGGGGLVIQPYQYVASRTYNLGYTNAMSLYPNDQEFEFAGALSRAQYAAELNVSVTDPDANKDGVFNDQGPIGAAQNNGRLRLSGRSTLNGYTFEYLNGSNGSDGLMPNLRVESPLFMITPPSNFTVRVLLEGYHSGSDAVSGGLQANLGTTAPEANGLGLKITLLENNANIYGAEVATAVSTRRYTDRDIANNNAGDFNFANVNYVFTDIPDGRYFVLVDHINHLPIMSRYAAQFQFSGDNAETWDVESGWNFIDWDGVANNVITQQEALSEPPLFGNKYTAFGNSETNRDVPAFGTTGLIFNSGRLGASTNALPAMVGGDVVKDGVINALDRTRVVADGGTTNARSLVKGNGEVNATDRQIVYRNSGKASSLPEDLLPAGMIKPNDNNFVPYAYDVNQIYPDAPEISVMFLEAERSYTRFPKKENNPITIQSGGLDYTVSGSAVMGNGFIDVSLYITNQGGAFGLGNSTFGIDYDASALRFDNLHFQSEMIFNQRDDLGYFPAFTAPSATAVNAVPNLRTIDVNYDNTPEANKPGTFVPYTKTYLGTLRFNIVAMQDEFKFNWHPITVVYSTDGLNITGDGTFDDIDAININRDVALIAPNGGEVLPAGRPYTIAWTRPNYENFAHIDFSSDNGATWVRITDEPVSLMGQKFNWVTPKIDSDQCLIALVNSATGTVIDRSKSTFTIATAEAQITRPASTDAVYKSGVNDYIEWNYDENVNVRFEFSLNGIDGWVSVGGQVNAKTGKMPWTIPNANTKSAKVRMIDVATNKVIAVSSPFRILAGAVTLVSPRTGEVLKAGETKPVRWVYDNVSEFDMQVSFNGGLTWEFLANDVKAAPRTHNWIVANRNTKEGIIRALYNRDPELEYSRSGIFEIYGATSVTDAESAGYTLSEAMPNPFNSETQFNFELPNDGKVTAKLYNAAGQLIQNVINGDYFHAGQHRITLDGTNLNSGVYVIEVSVNNYRIAREVVLIK